MATLRTCLETADTTMDIAQKGAARAVVTLYQTGGLISPRLAVAHEIEGSILDIANAQMQAAERNPDAGQRALQLAIAAFFL